MLVHIRWMIRRDVPEVLDIEEESFDFRWLEEDFIRHLRQPKCIGLVAEYDDRVVGFVLYELHKGRIHVLNFAVACDFRRCGVGRQMVEKLESKLLPDKRSKLHLEVRESNLPAQMFFRAMGFRADKILRSHYEDIPEDAYRMVFKQTKGAAASDYCRRGTRSAD